MSKARIPGDVDPERQMLVEVEITAELAAHERERTFYIGLRITVMGWQGSLRAIEAAERRAQRDAQRRFRELQRRAKEQAKLSALEQARLEVETYENRLEVLQSIHKEQGAQWNWQAVLNSTPPVEPVRSDRHEAECEARRAATMLKATVKGRAS